jgi:hypothetical protein
MLHSFLRAGAVLVSASLAGVGQALALSPLPLDTAAALFIPIQDEENKELWRDLQTGQTPPEAAVGNDAQRPRSWERATNLIDCEKTGGLWDVPTNRCLEKK